MNRAEVLSRTILLVKHGSVAYGLDTEASDLDLKGICVPTKQSLFGIGAQFENLVESQHAGHENDLVVYSLQKFCRLVANCNPTLLEVLFIDDESHLVINELPAKHLRAHRHLFLSKRAHYSFCHYASAQAKLMTRHEAKTSNAEQRSKSWKNCSHLIRLLRMCHTLLETGELEVFRENDRDNLLDIKNGLYPIEWVINEAAMLTDCCNKALQTTSLPEQCNMLEIDALVVDITKEYLKHEH